MSLQLPIEKIDIRDQYQIRFHLDETRVNEYAELMKDGVQFPPILVGEFVGYRGPDPDPTYFLLDGYHRLEAAKRVGKTAMIVNVAQVSSEADKIETALRANSQHGLPLTAEERRRAAMFLIRWYPKETLQKLARRCGVSKSTVARIRDELSQMGKLDLNGTTTGEDGKQRKQKYAERKEKSEIVKCPKCGKEELSTNLEKAGWVQNEKTGSWYCSEECRDWMAELMNEDNWEHQEHEPETGCDQKSQSLPEESQELPDSPSEPEPEPEPDQETTPKMVRCEVCGREAPLDAAMFHASSWIYDPDSFDSEKMTWTRSFCTPGCESRCNVEQSGNASCETNKEIHAKEIVEVLYGLYESTGYVNEDPLRAKEVHDLAWELYLKKVNGKENDE